MREPDARLMKSGDAPTDLNARTGLSTPPGRIAWARVKRREDRVVVMADGSWLMAYGLWRMDHHPSSICQEPSAALSHDSSPDANGLEIGDGERDEFLLVLVVRAVARGV